MAANNKPLGQQFTKALAVTEAAIDQSVEIIHDEDLPALTDDDRADIQAADMAEYTEPWNRMEHEGLTPFKYFCTFRDAGPARTSAMVSRIHDLSITTVAKYHKLYDWKSRALAFDQHEDRIYQTRRTLAIREMAERHGANIVDTIDGLMVPIRELQKRMEEDPQRVAEELDELATDKLVNLAARTTGLLPNLMGAERLARGMPTEITQVEFSGEVKHQISRDGIADVLEVLQAAGAFDGRGALGRTSEIIDVDPADIEVHSEESTDIRPES
jgi:hypothetical protein